MSYGLAGSQKGRAPQSQPPETDHPDTKLSPDSAPNAARRRGRLQALLAGVCALGVVGGLHLSHLHGSQIVGLTEQSLRGTWELKSIGANPIGPDSHSDVVSQRITLGDGVLHGETRLLATTPAGTVQMPFPDQSVTKVDTGDGNIVAASWGGSYKLLEGERIEVRIGKAQYRITIALDPKTHVLTMDHDAILTYRGASHYSEVLNSPSKKPQQD